MSATIAVMSDPHELEARRGMVVDDSDPVRLRGALELAMDYRGDVTLTRRSSGERIAGYVYDLSASGGSVVRVIPADGGDRVAIPCDDVAEISFTGRDTAEGKSFETWMKKYVEKKLAGERASIESEPLDET